MNVSGGFYVGNEKQEYLDRKAAEKIDDRLLKQIIDLINAEAPDVVCFQEIITTKEVNYIGRIVENTDLKHFEVYELSPCNIVANTDCGLAILSKTKITNAKRGLFPNPMITKTTASGNTYYTYDKGYLICDIDSTRILTHHGFPYGRFDSSAKEYPEIFEAFRKVILQEDVDIVTGDFNTEEDFMELLDLPGYIRTIDDITKDGGWKLDDILVKNGVSFKSKTIKTLSDHYALVTEI